MGCAWEGSSGRVTHGSRCSLLLPRAGVVLAQMAESRHPSSCSLLWAAVRWRGCNPFWSFLPRSAALQEQDNLRDASGCGKWPCHGVCWVPNMQQCPAALQTVVIVQIFFPKLPWALLPAWQFPFSKASRLYLSFTLMHDTARLVF